MRIGQGAPSGDCDRYYDLINNPERFTGYSGAPAANIWNLIYQQINLRCVCYANYCYQYNLRIYASRQQLTISPLCCPAVDNWHGIYVVEDKYHLRFGTAYIWGSECVISLNVRKNMYSKQKGAICKLNQWVRYAGKLLADKEGKHGMI